VVLATREGDLYRFDTRNFAKPVLAEKANVLPDGGTLTALSWLPAEISVVVGGSKGDVGIWFPVERKDGRTADGLAFTRAHAFPPSGSAITRIAVSQRTRMFVTGDAAGTIVLRHATTERDLLTLAPTPDSQGLAALQMAPRDDAVLAVGNNGKAALWQVSVPHPETNVASLLGRVWYEGYKEPEFTWQSTASTDTFEPKLSLIPVLFGTIKAALYSLIFATPIALMAAVYTSEFMHFRVRAVVKPTMELMASLPSVVVGFVAALVLSPIVENWVAAVIIAFAVVPLALVLAAHLWQILPTPRAMQLDGIPKLAFYFVVLAAAVWLSVSIGPAVEAAFFAGDFKAWSTGRVGDGRAFTFLILLPLAFLAVFAAQRRLLGSAYRMFLRRNIGPVGGLVDLGRWLAGTLVAALLAWIGAGVLASGGYDPRGGFVDTYVQRNALIVAFAIGFAIIPIIYTIAEDALNAVPEHLRSASLACGATKWQTAAWVILPTAMSGVFSAIMIGMGRAVGETMIVVMATGNTPVLDWNIFNGLRTLSANIAVELPEAVRDSTLYRTLFLCALALFILTFIVNTIAEMVRQRFRKRAVQL
jgi:phosphate transport system permease protein